MSKLYNKDNQFDDYLIESFEDEQEGSQSVRAPQQNLVVERQEGSLPQYSTLPSTFRKNEEQSYYEESFESESIAESKQQSQQNSKSKFAIHA